MEEVRKRKRNTGLAIILAVVCWAALALLIILTPPNLPTILLFFLLLIGATQFTAGRLLGGLVSSAVVIFVVLRFWGWGEFPLLLFLLGAMLMLAAILPFKRGS